MFALPFEESSAAGITAFYSIVNYETEDVALVFREFFRVMQNGALLLIAFHTGNKKLFIEDFFGKKVSMSFSFFDPDEIIALLHVAGFTVEETVIRYPYPDEYPSRRAYILAKKA